MRVYLKEWSRGRRQLSMRFAAGDLAFTTTLWYGDVDLFALEQRVGRDLMEKI